MFTFAKEGGGGTPPVPLEPSKKLQFCSFLLFILFKNYFYFFPTSFEKRINICTFAKEGGGGTPPVPLEPSKKLQFCSFLLFIGASSILFPHFPRRILFV